MNPIRREVLNGLFVLVVASLMSAAFAAFQVNFNLQLWIWIVSGVGITVGFYVVFEVALGVMTSAEAREAEWLKRVGTPARLVLVEPVVERGHSSDAEAVKTIRPGGDYTVMYYFTSEGGRESPLLKEVNVIRDETFIAILDGLKRRTIREYKRIICFDNEVLANDHELKSGVLRVGEGPGTIDRLMGEHCRLMLETKGCSLYVAPAVLRLIVTLIGVDKASIGIETFDQGVGDRRIAGIMFFCDPPNGEIIEQFRQIERATERRMVAVHRIRFPEDAAPTSQPANR